ncbi:MULTISPECIES: hypothetical protein [unclassified Arthrobacter]|uniref:hypothetical protein n=1 Tax=unclassified Arthrobacter TaxID=235627 RepID=UPI002DFB252F|nr:MULTISPECIES: hypothetical protein [unclassified Arthrobacter]MEC5192602.1 hypothetical protein [Arthrobacter sp. MP_M4]MEC5204086.1 hypothetical protein [Arthrobacter sp. MP_M7]
MTGSSSPSDPATVKAQVEQLKQAFTDLEAFQTETQKAIGNQEWAMDKNPVNGGCKTRDGEGGVQYRVIMPTKDSLAQEDAVTAVGAFWESSGFTVGVGTPSQSQELALLHATEKGKIVLKFYVYPQGAVLDTNSVCIAGDQTAIYKELYPENFGLPSNPGPSPTAK